MFFGSCTQSLSRQKVKLEEHQAVALWDGRGDWGEPAPERALLNSYGEVFHANLGDVEDESLPVFAGPNGSAPQVQRLWMRLQALSQRMCAAAESGEWDAVAEMQETSTALIAYLRPQLAGGDLSPAVAACKQQTLLALLRDDARLRALAAHQAEPPADGAMAPMPPHWLH